MRNVAPQLQDGLSGEQGMGFFLLELRLAAQTVYYTDCDVALYFDGNRYMPAAMTVRDIGHTAGFAIDTVTIDVAAVDLAITGMLLNADVAGRQAFLHYTMRGSVAASGAGEAVDVEFADGDLVFEDGDVVFAGAATPARPFVTLGTMTLLRGFVLGWHLAEKAAQIRIANEKMLWRKKALRLPTDSCPWVFGGEECRYAGAESWCDQSRERCFALGNLLNFGGRRAILAIETKKLWWGPKGTPNVQ